MINSSFVSLRASVPCPIHWKQALKLDHVVILVIPDLIDALLDKPRPRPSSMSYSPAHPRPMSGRHPSRVHFDDEGGPNLLADCMPLPSREEDPYNPRDGKT